MSERSGSGRLVGRAAGLLAVVGLGAYLFGLFGPARLFLFVGIAGMILAFVLFYIEEFAAGNR